MNKKLLNQPLSLCVGAGSKNSNSSVVCCRVSPRIAAHRGFSRSSREADIVLWEERERRMSATDGGLGPTPTWNEDTPTMTTLVVSSATSWLDYLQQVANAVQDQPVSAYDPVSSLQPKFATSAMCQILVFGIVFALGWVLFGLLIFSSRYHWPLSKINFCMQLAAVLAFLLQVSVSIIIVMLFSRERAQTWPYMFDYIELALPRDTWGDGEKAAWLFMQGFTALAIHVGHH